MNKIDKLEIVKKIINSLSESIKSIESSLNITNNLINDAPGAMQSHSDTSRFQLTSVLNASQSSLNEKSKSLQILKLFSRENLEDIEFDKIKNGAIVILEKNDLIENYFFLPAGSGIKILHNNIEITCITPTSPLGKNLLGKKKFEKFVFIIGSKSQKIIIKDIF